MYNCRTGAQVATGQVAIKYEDKQLKGTKGLIAFTTLDA